MSHGFYLVYDGPHPDRAQLRRFWHDAAHAAGLVDSQPWERTADVIEHVAGVGDLDVELVIVLDGDQPREVSIEGHWSSDDAPAAYRALVRAAQAFVLATGGRLENFDSGASLTP